MPSTPFIPDSAPFSVEQRAWLNGFFAALFSRNGAANTAAAAAAPALIPLTVLFGSQTGTAESLAKRAAKEAGKRGFVATGLDMAQTDLAKLAGERNVLVITSTYGEGEPPDNAKALWTALAKVEPGRLANLRFSVCSLGDTNYSQFCQCGKDFDARLENGGAARIADRVDCDLDYDEPFNRWLDGALNALANASSGTSVTPAPPQTRVESSASTAVAPTRPEETIYTRANPFPALLLTSRNLSAAGSAKEVRHVEFSLEGSTLAYEAGDALGVVPHNCPELVGEVLAALGCDGEEAVKAPDGTTTSLRHSLTAYYDLGKPSPDLIGLFAKRAHTTANTVATAAPLHVVDVLLSFPEVKLAPTEFVLLLKKIQPRLYSISSSPKAHPGQVHLTVGAVRYEANGRARKGVCSTFLADRAVPGETRVGVFVHSNKSFRPPPRGETPMIMVGPGTGIAPFRAFLEERRAAGASGKNWLFFGDQRASTDFLYREQLETHVNEGFLTRMHTAFSRDQAEKVYVQQRMLENGKELYAWLEEGAHFYVCGDASRMAKDVHQALLQIVSQVGAKTAEQAEAYVQALQAAKRYARDVY